jgi:antitoxin CptB
MADELEIRRKRLLYQASHRGTQESDLVVGGFAKQHLDHFGPAELDRFEALINVTDADLMDWLAGRIAPPKDHQGPILELMINFKNLLLND